MATLNITLSIRGISPEAFQEAKPYIMRKAHGIVVALALYAHSQVVSQLYFGHGSDTGHTRRTIHTDVIDTAHAVVGGSAHHMLYLEEGTEPHFPPVVALIPWSRRHDVSPWAVARAIASKGTEGYHMFRYGFEQTVEKLPAAVNRLAEDIIIYFASQPEEDWL